MEVKKFISISKKYKKCPDCGISWKDSKLQIGLSSELVTIKCECGFFKQVDEDNKEVGN